MYLYAILLVFIGLSVLLAWYLLSHDHGEREPIAVLWLAAGFGIIGAILASQLESWLLPGDSVTLGVQKDALLASALGTGFIEEICKFLPLAVYIYKKRFFNEQTDGIIYFALAGLAFGLPENILYTLQFGTETGLSRVFLTPLFHAAATGTIGYFLIKNKLAKKSVWRTGGVLVIIALLHGLYNFGLIAGQNFYQAMSLLITLGLSITLFSLFQRAGDHDQNLGLSRVGHNNFCRSCGTPNPLNHLYCTHCGKNA